MTDFDTRLRARLERLDASIPASPPPALSADEGSLPQPPPTRSSRPRRRRKVAILLAAAAALVAASVVAAQRVFFDDVPQPALEAGLAELFADRDCIKADEATSVIRQLLDELGHDDWEIETRPAPEQPGCVYPAVITPLHTVALLPGAGRAVAEAMEQVGDELLRQCLGRDDATGLVSSVLSSLGVRDFTVSSVPWGPKGAPIDQFEAYERHVAAGCFVLVGGVSRDPEGRPTYHLWGRWF